MPYPLRHLVEDATYHVTMRGNNRGAIFADERDYRHYVTLLRRYKTRHGFKCYAYALMPNHVHLLLRTKEQASLSQVMQCLSIAYTRYFNHRHQRVGHVFQGRFHSRTIEDENYLLVASRYVHLNPVRARLVDDPLTYPWSSYRAYATEENPWDLVDAEELLGLLEVWFGVDPKRSRNEYRTFVELKDVPQYQISGRVGSDLR